MKVIMDDNWKCSIAVNDTHVTSQVPCNENTKYRMLQRSKIKKKTETAKKLIVWQQPANKLRKSTYM